MFLESDGGECILEATGGVQVRVGLQAVDHDDSAKMLGARTPKSFAFSSD